MLDKCKPSTCALNCNLEILLTQNSRDSGVFMHYNENCWDLTLQPKIMKFSSVTQAE